MVIDTTLAAQAFTEQAPGFDAIDAADPLIGRMRTIVRTSALRYFKPGDDLLELNAGTGIDSFYFASKGIHVLATDVASGMIAQLKAKQATHPELKVDIEQCSFLDLHLLGDRKFQHVFSNFGGLNCTDRLDLVLRRIDRVLLPNGTCALVIMPRFSPWEVITALKGNFKLAFRRFRKKSTPAHLEGVVFPCFYYAPSYVRKHLGEGYEVLEQRALSLVVPPPHMVTFSAKWPTLFYWLNGLETRLPVVALPQLGRSLPHHSSEKKMNQVDTSSLAAPINGSTVWMSSPNSHPITKPFVQRRTYPHR